MILYRVYLTENLMNSVKFPGCPAIMNGAAGGPLIVAAVASFARSVSVKNLFSIFVLLICGAVVFFVGLLDDGDGSGVLSSCFLLVVFGNIKSSPLCFITFKLGLDISLSEFGHSPSASESEL